MADTRDKDIATIAHASAGDDWNRKDGTTSGTRKISPFDEAGQFRNPLAPRPCVAFDGTASSKIYSTLTNQAIGTDDCGTSGWFKVPSSSPSANMGLMALSSSNTAPVAATAVTNHIDTATVWHCRIYGATGSAYLGGKVDLTPWAGKKVFLWWKRVGATLTMYVNGIAQAQTTEESLPYSGAKYTAFFNANNNYLSTPSVPANVITGDITIDVFCKLIPTTGTGGSVGAGKNNGAGHRAYLFEFAMNGLIFSISSDGTATSQVGANHSPTLDGVSQTDTWLKVTRRQSDGVTRFYHSADSSTWTKFGTDQILLAGTPINAGDSAFIINNNENNEYGTWNLYKTRLYNGFFDDSGPTQGGTLKQSFDSNDATDGTSAVTSAATGEVWSLTTSGGGTNPSQFVVESVVWSRSITNTYLVAGLLSSSEVFVGKMAWVTFWNYALADADVLEVYEGGGPPPERLKWGSQVLEYSSDFSAGANGWSNQFNVTVDGNIDGIGGQNDTLRLTPTANNASHAAVYQLLAQGRRKWIELKLDYYIPSANTVAVKLKFGDATTVGVTGAVLDAWTTMSVQIFVDNTNPEQLKLLPINSAGSSNYNANGTDVLYVKNIKIRQLGAVCVLACDEGVGFQLRDGSSNKLDGVMSTSGITHVIPQRRGYVRIPGGGLTWSGTHEAKSWLGQRALPDGAVITLLTTKSTATATGQSTGTTNSATRWSAAAAATANTKRVATLANQLPAAATDNDRDIVSVPDGSNFTGTVSGEVHYSVTEDTV